MLKIRRVLSATLAIVVWAAPAAAAADGPYVRFPQLDEQTEFVDSWGDSRSGGRRHRGIDLMGTKLSPVVAVLDGVIETSGHSRLSGYYIKIDHEGGISSWYMHLNNDSPGTDDGRGGPEGAFAEGLQVGDMVEAGQVIGFVGDSGNAEGGGPHTHFELHIDGQPVNPYAYLREAWERWMLVLAIERGETDFK